MLQIIFTLFIFLFSVSANAQDENVPAFLKQEATQNQYGTPPASMQGQQPVSAIPAFLMSNEERIQMQQQQQLQQQQMMLQQQQPQNQYNYQSADPNSGVFTLPPAVYQPAPGDVPAFVQQEQSGEPQQAPAEKLKTNNKEDTIQINFSDDQYKQEQESQKEVTTLDKEQATKYNTEVQKETQGVGEPTEELPEGAKFEGQTEDGKVVDKDAAAKSEAAGEKPAISQVVPEPAKATTNLMRISYSKEDIELSEKDKASLLTVVRLLKSDRKQKIALKAYTSQRDLGADPRKVGLTRIIGIREFLMKQGVDFSQTDVKVIEPELNKEDLDYIDIDKI